MTLPSRLLKLSVAAAAVAATAGCATYENGPYEKISVTSKPAGALCKLYRDGQGGYQKSISTPGEKYLRRDGTDVTVVCSKKGYKTTTVVLESQIIEGAGAGNLSNLGVGYLVDGLTGARFGTQGSVEVVLEQL